jgi:hypothetical protein
MMATPDTIRRKGAAVTSRRSCLVILVASSLVLWLLAIVFSVAIIDSQLNNDGRRHRSMGEFGLQNQEEIANSLTSMLPDYPINHRGHAFAAKLSIEAVIQCHRALWHTLETTTIVLPNEETFVITGDIKDMVRHAL